jgi:hypothetical protein
VHSLNCSSNQVTVEGMLMYSSDEHSLNMGPTSRNPSLSFTFLSDVQRENASTSMLQTDDGSTMLSNEEHPSNAEALISVSPSWRSIFSNDEQSLNAPVTIFLT